MRSVSQAKLMDPVEDVAGFGLVSHCGQDQLPSELGGWAYIYKWNAVMKSNIVSFGLVGTLALALSTTTSLAQASYTDNSYLSAAGSPLMLVRGGGGGGGGGGHGGGMGGGGFGGGHGGGMGGGGFGGGHIGGMGGSGFGGGHIGGMGGHGGRMAGSRGVHGGHFHNFRHHARSRFLSGYDDYGCYWSRRYHRLVCSYS